MEDHEKNKIERRLTRLEKDDKTNTILLNHMEEMMGTMDDLIVRMGESLFEMGERISRLEKEDKECNGILNSLVGRAEWCGNWIRDLLKRTINLEERSIKKENGINE